MTQRSKYRERNYTFANHCVTVRTAIGITQAELATQSLLATATEIQTRIDWGEAFDVTTFYGRKFASALAIPSR